MLTKTGVTKFAEQWVAAWNSHDLEAIMSHYEDDVELISPVAAQLLQDPNGRVIGRDALRDYFKKDWKHILILNLLSKTPCGV